MTEIHISEHREQPTAVLRERVPLRDMQAFFGRAFHATMAAIQAAGVHPVGPPFGLYHGMPADTVDVEAGFPVSAPITATGDVTPSALPAGTVVEAMHIGSYDTLSQTYDAMVAWASEQGLTPGDVMWESYLSDPEQEPDPTHWRTQLCWPVA